MLHTQVFRTVRIPVGGKIHKQAGFASILLILLIGLALTTLIIGMVTSVRGLQGSSLTAHAQTQAQIKSAIGYQALSGLLSTLSATQIASINNGTIKQGTTDIATYTVTTDCPTSTPSKAYSCYDVKAISGGASSIVRAVYATKTTGVSSFSGSIFAGGLQVGHTRNLQGNQTMQVGSAGGGNGIVKGNGNNYYSVAEFAEETGLSVQAYQGSTFLTAEEARAYANYMFYSNGTCAKNNLYNTNALGVSTIITIETTPSTTITLGTTSVGCSSISGITTSGSGSNKTWKIDADNADIPVGVLWFEGAVTVNLKATRDLVNTIIATGTINVSSENGGSSNKAYAPNYYNLESSANAFTKKLRICGSAATGIPTQYCANTGTLTSLSTELSKIANILFLSNGDITFDVKNNKPMNLYGNIIGAGGAGGTGAASGKFTGTGDIAIKGNLAFSGTGTTITNGNINVTLTNSDPAGNAAPSKKVMSLSSLRYM